MVGEVLVVQLFVDHHRQHGQGKGPVGAGPNGDPLRPGTLHRLGAAGIDHDDSGAAPGGCFEPVHIQGR